MLFGQLLDTETHTFAYRTAFDDTELIWIVYLF